MKKFKFILIFVILGLILSISLAAISPDTIVYITDTGKKYHNDGCQYLKKSKIPIKIKDAVAAGYEPCSKCDPPEYP